MLRPYLEGLLHDGTKREYTYRITQNNKEFVERIQSKIEAESESAWIYEEGNRGVYTLEFSKSVVRERNSNPETEESKIHYVRGYFDAEGGIPSQTSDNPYIYFAQKGKTDLVELKQKVESLGLNTGRIHLPSQRKPNYWRFYISRDSHRKFFEKVGSWHPEKHQRLREMIQSAL